VLFVNITLQLPLLFSSRLSQLFLRCAFNFSKILFLKEKNYLSYVPMINNVIIVFILEHHAGMKEKKPVKFYEPLCNCSGRHPAASMLPNSFLFCLAFSARLSTFYRE
jgi:hypothetical protein